MDEPGVGGEFSIGSVSTDPELRVVAIACEQALKGEGFAQTGRAFHPSRRRLDRPSKPIDRRSPRPFARSPGAQRFQILVAQARLANGQRYERVDQQPPVVQR
jgi:hypothetical protein